jgi:hypothetical protein
VLVVHTHKHLLLYTLLTHCTNRPETDPEQPSGLRWHVRTEYKQLLHAPQHMGMLPAELEYADRAAAYRAKRAAEGGGDAPSPTKKVLLLLEVVSVVCGELLSYKV